MFKCCSCRTKIILNHIIQLTVPYEKRKITLNYMFKNILKQLVINKA